MPGGSDFAGQLGSDVFNTVGMERGIDAQHQGYGAALEQLRRSLAEYEGVKAPEFSQYDPSKQVSDAYGNNPEDPADRANQLKVFDALMGTYNQGGFDTQARATYAQAINGANQASTGQAGAAQQQLQSRGLGNSGLSLAATMQGNQNQGQMLGSMGTQIAGDANSRRMQALGGAAGVAGQMRGQDWSEINAKSQAQNALNQWNAEFARQAQMLNNSNMQQGFQDQMGKAGAQAGIHQQMGNLDFTQGKEDQANEQQRGRVYGQMTNNLFDSAGQFGGG